MAGNIRLYNTSGYVELQAPSSASAQVLELPTDSIKPALVHLHTETFSAQSTVSIDDVFSSTYANYKVVLGMVTHSSAADVDLNMRLRVSGTDNTTTNYFFSRNYGNNSGTNSSTGGVSATSWGVAYTSQNRGNLGTMDVYSPQATSRTGYQVCNFDGGSAPYVSNYAGLFNATTSFDGFTLFTGSGNFSGSIRIYGYRNS